MKGCLDDNTEHQEVEKTAEEFEIKKDPDGVRVINGIRYIGIIPEDEWLEHLKKKDREFRFRKIAISIAVISIRIGAIVAAFFLWFWLKKIFY